MHLMPLQVGRSSSEHLSILQQLRIMRADDFERCCGAPAVVHILIRRLFRLSAMSGRPCCKKLFNFQALHPRIQLKSDSFFCTQGSIHVPDFLRVPKLDAKMEPRSSTIPVKKACILQIVTPAVDYPLPCHFASLPFCRSFFSLRNFRLDRPH